MPGILVGVDGSGDSYRALRWAIEEAGLRQLPLTVLTVHQPVDGYLGGPIPLPADPRIPRQAREMAQKETESALREAGSGSWPPEVMVLAVAGQAAHQLLTAAADADMVVLGSRGAGGFRRLLLGSVSAQVLQHAQCPVVVVHRDHRGDQ